MYYQLLGASKYRAYSLRSTKHPLGSGKCDFNFSYNASIKCAYAYVYNSASSVVNKHQVSPKA